MSVRSPRRPRRLASGGAEGDPTIWDITQFAWVGGPWPGGQSAFLPVATATTPTASPTLTFDAFGPECDATVDDAERAACYNELDTYVTTLDNGDDGLFMIPLTQKPSLLRLPVELSSAAPVLLPTPTMPVR